MKTFKNQQNDPESYRTIYFQVGVIIALLCVLYAFEYKSYEHHEVSIIDRTVDNTIEVMIPITKQPEEKTSPPPQPTIRITISDDPDIIDEDLLLDATADQDTPFDWVPVDEPDEPIVEPLDIPIYIAEYQPTFSGGSGALNEFINDNIIYPELAKELGITGKVYVDFVVEKDGSLSNISIKRGIGGGCDEESLRLIESMPKWNPGMQNGRPVRVMLTLPIKFTLR